MPTTYTVAQALAAPMATGIHVVDTAANIANALPNPSLVSRVTLFSMSANGTVSAAQSEALAGLGSEFSAGSDKLTVKDTVAALTSLNNAAGLAMSGILVAVQDTAPNILAAITNPIIHHATSVALTANATLTLANLVALEGLSSFTTTGLTLTLSDTAANLLAFVPSEAKPALTIFQVGISSTVTAAQALTLEAMQHFNIAGSATLTVADTMANLAADAAALYPAFVQTGAAVIVSDTLADLLAQGPSFPWASYPNVRAMESNSGTVLASQAVTLASLPNFSVAFGQTLTIADTVAHLVTLTQPQAAIATTISLSANDTATAAQLVILATLPHFSAVHTLTLDDTLADIATLTTPQRAVANAETIDDTVSHLLAAASSALTGATGFVAELDGTVLTAAQAVTLAALASNATLTLHPNGNNTTLTISDSSLNLSNALASIVTLEADGPVTVITTSYPNRTILTAAAAATLVESGTSLASATLAVADTGSAISSVAGVIFGHGFEAITVTSGSFAGTLGQLLDPTLHFAAGSAAQLDANAVATVARARELAALPGFNRAANTTLEVLGSIGGILAAAATLPTVATSILANDSEIVTAAQAATLATLTGFSLNNNVLTVDDTAANLAAATPGAIALATTINLTSDARITEATALLLVALGNKFSSNGFFVTIADTAANLEALAGSPSVLARVNGWNGEAVLSADATATVANVVSLMLLTGFNAGPHHLTIADTAGDLLGAGGAVLALASVVQLSQAATETAANAALLEALPDFSANSLLTISDTPADLAAMAASVATPASIVSLPVETVGNAAGYAIDPAQFTAMLALPHFSLSSFAGTIAVSGTAAGLKALVPSMTSLSPTARSHITTTLDVFATVSVATAEALHGLPSFSVGSYSLTISDTAAALTTLDNGTAALASAIEVNAPVTVNAATAATLQALHNFTTDINPITIADTPANIAAMSLGAAGIAGADAFVPITGANAADYTLSTTQFLQLTANLVAFPDYAGPLIVQGTALQLASLAGAFISASPASPIAESRSILTTDLSASATVTAQVMAYLIGMPGFSLNGNILVLQDAPTALIAAFSEFVPYASEVELAANDTPWTVTAAQAAQLAAIGPLNAGPAGMLVADTVANLLTVPYATGIADATATTLSQNATVSVAQADALDALPDFSRGGYTLTISDTAANIATLQPAVRDIASAIVTVGQGGGGAALTVAAFNALVTEVGFSGTLGSLVVSDTAAQLLTLVGGGNLGYIANTVLNASATLVVADAERLSTLPGLLVGSNLTIADTASNLLQITGNGTTPDAWTIEQQATLVELTQNATGITAAQATLLALLGTHFSNGGYSLTIQDSTTALLGLSNVLGPISSQIDGITPSSGGTISLAQARQLAVLPDFSFGTASLTIADSLNNLSASANASLIVGIIAADPNVTFTLTGDATATVAQAGILHALGGHFSLGDDTLSIVDGAAHLATLDAGTAAMATEIELRGSALVTVAQFEAIRALPNYSNNGNMLEVSDTAGNLLGLVSSDVSLAGEIRLSANAINLLAAQAEQLVTLSNFSTGTAHITIQDTAADLLQVTGDGLLPDDWAGELAASAVTLSAGATVNAAEAAQLALLGSRFSVGTNTLTVSDTAAALLLQANADGLALAGVITLSGNETALSAEAATQLAGMTHFSKGGFQITVSDTAEDLTFSGYAAGVALADHMQLSQPADMTVAAAEALIGMARFQVNGAAPITIVDTLPALLGLADASLPFHTTLLTMTGIALSANAVATAAQIAILTGLPEYGAFSVNGHALTVEDSGENLATLTPTEVADATSVVMVGDAILTAAQADSLALLSPELGPYKLIVIDTATDLLNGANAAGLSIATHIELSAATTLDAADATTLFANPAFSTGGYALTITGSASALLGLGATALQAATALQLSESGDVVDAAQLAELAGFGNRFSLHDNTLTVSDTADQLASLNDVETALVHAAVIDQTEIVDTATATALGALPNLSLGADVTLTVQGSFAALAALPADITAIATLELIGGAQTLTAAEAAALASAHNISIGADVVVQDTIAGLNAPANAGWQSVATGGYVVTDSAGNLLANIDSPLLAGANSVTLLSDAQMDASNFAMLAGLANFSRGNALLVVADDAAAIANNATDIALLASGALVDTAAPVSASQAEALAQLNTAHLLSFAGGISLAVQDTLDNLLANPAGLALAGMITVLGTGAQLAGDTAYVLGSVQPYYALNADSSVTGLQAVTLHAMGSHFLLNDYTLVAADTVAGVVNNAAAIQALGIGAQVTDSVADVDAAIINLVALGTTLQSVSLNDTAPVQAAAAAGLVTLVAKLTGPPILVADTAPQVAGNAVQLEALSAHISSVTVTDTAEDVATAAVPLAALALDTTVHIVLTDGTADTPVLAAIAAGLVGVDTLLGGATVSVLDTGVDVAAEATVLAELGAVLGTITLSDGTTTSAATAAAIVPIAAHLGIGVRLSVTDSAAAIAGAADGLTTLLDESRLGSVTSNAQSVTDIVAYGATLATLGAKATISDSASDVSGSLAALDPYCGAGGVVTQIVLNNGGTPDIALSLQQLTDDANVLGLISGTFKYAITDTGENIADDLGAGAGSQILTLGSKVDTIALSESSTLTLPVGTLMAEGVDEGLGSAVAKLAGGIALAASGVTIQDFGNFAELAVAPTSFAVADSGSDLAQDLESGMSVLLAHRTAITSIAPTGAITLDYATASAVNVDDGAGSVFSKMPDATLDVTGVPVIDIVSVFSAGVPAASITVTGSAGAIATDLESGASALVHYSGQISGITVSPGGSVTLDATHALAAGVDDGAGSVFGKMTGGTLTVTGATVLQFNELLGLPVVPISIAIGDSASAVEANLEQGAASTIEENVGLVSFIAVTGTIELGYTQASLVLPALTKLTSGSLIVDNVPVGNVATIAQIGPFTTMTVTGSAGAVASSLILDGSSPLATYATAITALTVTGGPVVLTDAQALNAAPAALALLPAGSLDVTGVAIGDIANVAAIGAPLASMTVTGTALAITADLRNGAGSELELHAGKIASITPSSGTVVLADSDAWAVTAALARLSADSLAIGGASVLHAETYATLGGLISMSISDTAADIRTDLDGGNSLLEAGAVAHTIAGITVTDTAVQLLDAQAEQVLAALALFGGAGVVVSGVSVTDIPNIGGLGSALAGMTISDTNTDILADLVKNTGSELYQYRSKITGVTVTGGQVEVASNQVADVQLAALALLPVGTLVVTGAPVDDVAGLAALTGLQQMTVSDTASAVQTDLASGGAHVLETNHLLIGSIAVTSGQVTLDDSDAEASLAALTLLTGSDVLVVTGVSVGDVPTIAGLGSLAFMTVTDTAIAIERNLQLVNSSLEAHAGLIQSIGFADDDTSVTLSGIEAARVMDALVELPGASLTVTGASEAQVAALAALGSLLSMTVSDTASAIQGDLSEGAASTIEESIGLISGIAVTGTIELNYTQASLVLPALGRLTSGSLIVDNVPVGDVATIGQIGPFTTMTVTGSADAVAGSLILDGSSPLATYATAITSLTVTGGPVVLFYLQALNAAAAALALLPAGSLDVTSVAVGDIGAIGAIGAPLASMTVSGAAGAITTDLQAGAADSELEQYAGKISSVIVTSGTVTLSDADAHVVTTALAKLSSESLVVTGVPMAHIATYTGLLALQSITVADAASTVHGDLISGNSVLENDAATGVITGITVNDAPVSLTDTQAEGVLHALGVLNGTGGLSVTGVSMADIPVIGALGALTGMTVSGSNTDIASDLEQNTASELYQYRDKITGLTVTAGQVDIASNEIANVQLAALALLPADTLVVTGVLVAEVAGLAGLTGLYQMTVSDTAVNVQDDLGEGGAHVLETDHTNIGSIAVTGGQVTLSGLYAEAALGALALVTGSDVLVVVDASISDIGDIAGIAALASMTVSASAGAVHADLVDGASSVLEQNAALISAVGFSSGISVTLSGAQAALVMDALGKLPDSSLMVTGALEAQVGALAELGSLVSMTVTDSAAHIQMDLALGAESPIENAIGQITGIAASGTIELTYGEASLVLPALGELTSGSLLVDAVPLVDVAQIGALGGFVSMTVTGDADDIANSLILDGSSPLETYASAIVGMTVTGGSIVLTDAQALAAALTASAALSVLPHGSLEVTGVALGDVANVALIGAPLAGMMVSDSASAITTDLLNGSSSVLEQNANSITGITPSGTVALTDSDAWAVRDALAKLSIDTLTVSNASVAHAAIYAGLAGLISMTIFDTAADITPDLADGNSVLEAGAAAHTITGITVAATPVLLTDAQAEPVLAALALFSTGGVTVSGVSVTDIAAIAGLGLALTGMSVSDTNADILADLLKGGSSELYLHASAITGGVTLTDGGTVDITNTDLPNVELSALALLPANTLVVTGAPVADVAALSSFAGLYQLTVSDSAANVQADLASGGLHVLELDHTHISSISLTSGPVTLEDSDAIAAIDALTLLSGTHVLVVNDVLVGDVTTIAGLGALAYMTVTDTAADIQGDLELDTSFLEANAGVIHSIGFAEDGGTSVTLSGLEAGQVMDALAKLPAASLTVTGAAEAQVAALAGLSALSSMTVTDSAAHIQSDLALGAASPIETAIAQITGIAATGTIELSYDEASLVLPALGELTSGSLLVDDVPVGEVAEIGNLAASIGPQVFTRMTVSDSAANLADSLIQGNGSALGLYASEITSVTVTGGPIVLTDAQALAVGASAVTTLPDASVEVTGVAIGNVASVAGIVGAQLDSMAVTGVAMLIGIDLQQGADSVLEQNAGKISSITPSGGPGAVALADSAAWVVTAALAKLSVDSLTISGASVLHAATYATLPGLLSMSISDIAADITADLTGGASLLETGAAAHTITGITVTDTAVQLTDTQAESVLPALALFSTAGVSVSGVSVADIANIGGLGAALASMTVSDSNTDILADLLENTGSELYEYRGKITIAAVTGGAIQIAADQLPDVQLAALALLPADTLVVTDALVADVAELSGLTGLYRMTVTDTAAAVQADMASGGAQVLEANHALITSIAVTNGLVSLDDSDADAAIDALHLLSGTDTLIVTAVSISDMGNIAGIAALDDMTISDTAIAIRSNLLVGATSSLEEHAGQISAIAFSVGNAISLTGAQAALVMGVLGDLPGASLTVTDAAVAQVGALGALASLATMTVSDTAAQIGDDLALGASSELEQYAASIGSIGSTTGTVALNYGDVAAVTDALAKMSSDALAVDDVPVADVVTIVGLGAVLSSMTVLDTSGAVQADLDNGGSSVLQTNASRITAIGLSAGAVSVTDGVADLVTAALALLPEGSLTVSGVPVGDIAAIYGLGAPLADMTVSDTGADIAASLISGGQIEAAIGKISSIGVTSGVVALNYTQAAAVTNALLLLPANSLTVSAVPLADIAAIAAYGGLASMTVTGTGTAIGGDLANGSSSVIENHVAQISSIVPTGELVSLSDAQADAVTAALGKLPGGTLTVSGVPLSDVAHIASLGAVASMTVLDAASTVQADLATGSILTTAVNKIGSIGLVSGGQITLTDAQADAAFAVLDKLPGDSLAVTGVLVSDIAAIAGLSSLASMTVLDSAAAILADVNNGGVIAGHIGAITSVAVDEPLGASNAVTIYLALGSKFDESAQTISDTASNLIDWYADDSGAFSAAEQVTLSGNASANAADATTLYTILRGALGGRTLGVVDTASALLDPENRIGIDFATSATLNGVLTTDAATATSLAGLNNFNTHGPAITVQDTPADLLDTAAYAAGLAIATAVGVNAAVSVSATTLTALSNITNFAADSFGITVAGNAAAIAGLSVTALGVTALAQVTDSSANVLASLGGLQTGPAHGDVLSIILSDGTPGTPTIFINAATYTADRGAIDSITTPGAVNVTDGAAALAAIASELASDSEVGVVDVTDSAAAILSNLTALESIGSKFQQTTITDTTLNASEVSALLTLPNLHATNLTISDTGSQIAAAIEANGPAGLTFLNSHSVALSGPSIIAASDAVVLEELAQLQTDGHALVVWDTASHLTDSVDGYLAAVQNPLISAVYLKTTGGTATITAATAALLLSIGTFNKNNPPLSVGGTGTPNVVTLSDSAAHINSEFSALNGHTASLSGIVVNASASVTDTIYGNLLTLGATMATSTSLTVRDTAATIIANAPGQLGAPHSITPAAWQVSGSASVSESGAAFLGSIGVNAGVYTLTLTGSDSNTSVVDANNIGLLGSAFHLGGYQLTVNGTVSYVSALTMAAQAVVTVDIADTFSQIVTLTLGDGLLNGTIAVNDSENTTVAAASAFLALLGGAGIPVANVSFGGHVESIIDTLSDVQSLTSGIRWTGNTSLHADFSLTVADSVADLINPTNTTALAGMAGTTLNANQVVSAANAESLFGLQSTIHFNLGATYSLVIQDGAANLLNQANSDGEALATYWQLASADSTNAAGAEALLPDSKFHLNHLLTVSDTSDNLLDGVLSGVIATADAADAGYGGSIQVTLSDVETLDATTAEALVSVTGFSNTGNPFSIADSSAYLLNSNNAAAEADATSITLAGDESVSASTAARLAALPNFNLTGGSLALASNDYANAATLKAIADFGSGFTTGSYTLTMTQDDVSLTPTEYAALQSDNVLQNGHALSAMPVGANASSSSGDVVLTATGVSGATLNVYAAGGSMLSHTTLGSSAISVTQADAFGTVGGAVVITETMPGQTTAAGESAPLIVLDQSILTGDLGSATFSATGGAGTVQVGVNQYMHLYTAGSQVANPVNPELVYDATAHTLSFEVASTSIVLVTLGAQTHPVSLGVSEILVTHFG